MALRSSWRARRGSPTLSGKSDSDLPQGMLDHMPSAPYAPAMPGTLGGPALAQTSGLQRLRQRGGERQQKGARPWRGLFLRRYTVRGASGTRPGGALKVQIPVLAIYSAVPLIVYLSGPVQYIPGKMGKNVDTVDTAGKKTKEMRRNAAPQALQITKKYEEYRRMNFRFVTVFQSLHLFHCFALTRSTQLLGTPRSRAPILSTSSTNVQLVR
eukprot:gene12757-biopygen441